MKKYINIKTKQEIRNPWRSKQLMHLKVINGNTLRKYMILNCNLCIRPRYNIHLYNYEYMNVSKCITTLDLSCHRLLKGIDILF